MLTRPSFKKSLIEEQFQGNYLKLQSEKRSSVPRLVNKMTATSLRFQGVCDEYLHKVLND